MNVLYLDSSLRNTPRYYIKAIHSVNLLKHQDKGIVKNWSMEHSLLSWYIGLNSEHIPKYYADFIFLVTGDK